MVGVGEAVGLLAGFAHLGFGFGYFVEDLVAVCPVDAAHRAASQVQTIPVMSMAMSALSIIVSPFVVVLGLAPEGRSVCGRAPICYQLPVLALSLPVEIVAPFVLAGDHPRINLEQCC